MDQNGRSLPRSLVLAHVYTTWFSIPIKTWCWKWLAWPFCLGPVVSLFVVYTTSLPLCKWGGSMPCPMLCCATYTVHTPPTVVDGPFCCNNWNNKWWLYVILFIYLSLCKGGDELWTTYTTNMCSKQEEAKGCVKVVMWWWTTRQSIVEETLQHRCHQLNDLHY